jgi:hypothetical protein
MLHFCCPSLFLLHRDQLIMLPTMLLALLEAGFNLYHIPWGITFTNPAEPLGYGAPLPVMETISRKHVEYDLWSAEKMRWVVNQVLVSYTCSHPTCLHKLSATCGPACGEGFSLVRAVFETCLWSKPPYGLSITGPDCVA